MKHCAHRRHDISDKVWNLLSPHLPGQAGGVLLKIIDCLSMQYSGYCVQGRDLPPDYGDWNNTNRRFCRWRDKGIWEKLLNILVDEPDYEWLMIDASHIKVHPHAAGG